MIENLPTVDEVILAVENALKKTRTVETLTFSGNGETMLHPDFSKIVSEVKTIRDKIRPDVKIAVLSNASFISNQQIINALSLIDMPIMKLDAGDEKTFRSVNHPIETLQLGDLLDGLESLPGLIIQSMMIDGEISNIHGHAYERWESRLKDLHPLKVQLYSADRPTAVSGVKQVSSGLLTKIANDLSSRCQLDIESFWRE